MSAKEIAAALRELATQDHAWDCADDMKEAADELERQLATLLPNACGCPACRGDLKHSSDCAVHNMPAMPNGLCSCGAVDVRGVMEDAARYRKLRAAWWDSSIVWDEPHQGITHARGDDLDKAVDALYVSKSPPERGGMILDEPRIRLTPAFFAEVLMLPSGNVEYVRLERVERWLLERDHEIALLMNERHSTRSSND